MPRRLNYQAKRYSRFLDKIKKNLSGLKDRSIGFAKKIYRSGAYTVSRRPFLSFISLLGLLFLAIVVSNLLQKPKPEATKPPVVKKVEVYRIGSVPKVHLQAQVEKSGVIAIVAQTAGIVQNIYVKEGDKVTKGKWLLTLSSNYQGGNALAVQREIAQKQNQLMEENYPAQKELISKQRDLANETETNFEKMRDITSQSINDTQNLINLNNTIISSLNDTINTLSSTLPNATSSAMILSTQEMVSQFQSANLQLNNSLRNAQYQSDSDNPPSKIANLQKDITMKQLDVQDKALDLNKEISNLQLKLAYISEAAMYPASPANATVERIFVKKGQAVSPGTTLFTLSSTGKKTAKAIVYVSKDMRDKISCLEPAIFTIGNMPVSLQPAYITTEAITGNLYGVIYYLPEENYEDFPDKGYIPAAVPIGYPDTGVSFPYIPIDAIYQTQEESFLYTATNGIAKTRKVTLGEIYGSSVQVMNGITSGDIIIINRNVVDGDKVEISN